MNDRDRLIELFDEMDRNPEITCPVPNEPLACKTCKYSDGSVWFCDTVARRVDYLLANGVIVPPCKVGDTVWVNWENPGTGKKETRQASVYALRFDTKKNNMRICVEGNFEIKAYGGRFTHYYNATFAWNSVGKTVFLTKEEAEQALKEREQGGN